MSNRYGSANRILRARNVAEKAMPAPGATDLTVATADFVRQIFNLKDSIFDLNTNFRLRRIGVFSNFADGLVFANPDERLDVIVQAVAARSRIALSGTSVQTTFGSKNVVGVGTSFNTELIEGDTLRITDVSGNYPRYYELSATPAGALAATLTDYSKTTQTVNIGSGRVTKLALDNAGAKIYTIEDISELNFLYDIEHFFDPATYFASNVTLPGTGQLTAGSTAFVGVGTAFTNELIAGDQVTVGSTTVTISSITDNTNAVLTANSSANEGPGATITRLASTNPTITDIIIRARINSAQSEGIESHDVDFLIDSVAAAFTGDTVTFDVVGEFEFTV